MEQIHRKRIDDLIEIVPCFIDMVTLWPYLIQTGIFNQDDCNIPTWSRMFSRIFNINYGRNTAVQPWSRIST